MLNLLLLIAVVVNCFTFLMTTDVIPEYCGNNEVWNMCSNGGCRRWYCSDDDTMCKDPAECEEGCVCRDKYARNDDGECVPESQCAPLCKRNEKYVECPDQVCKALTCDQLGFPLTNCDYTGSEPCPGKPGCICENGKVRNSHGICIPVSHCPSCGGDKNAESGCGNPCGNTCDNVGKNVACAEYCLSNGCDCKHGYLYSNKQDKCVLPSQCP